MTYHPLFAFTDNNFNKSEIDINYLIESLVREFDLSLTLSEGKPILSNEQKELLGRAVFFNPKVIKRLEEVESAKEEDEISNFEEYLNFKKEALNGKE